MINLTPIKFAVSHPDVFGKLYHLSLVILWLIQAFI